MLALSSTITVGRPLALASTLSMKHSTVYSQAKLNAVARRLKERPRKTLDYETPAERFQQTIASTG
jgi:IS30 family transposase